ncbi:hypothetical protein BDD12DRAFT_976954 [Trichophaea hybrida]|nr:hypothetical protein BDD12DRAFT_976954 [Trichophaea hybrida]
MSDETHALQQRDQSFKGSAWVRISAINISSATGREVNVKNVERLKNIFELEGCLPKHPHHHVPVLVKQGDFESGLRSSDVTAANLKNCGTANPPTLKFPDRALECLHGKHRLLAARSHLPPKDQLWVVDLYVESSQHFSLVQDFHYEYPNSLNMTDGEIFWHILLDDANAGEWMARLSSTKRKDLKQLLRHPGYKQAFLELLPVPGLWVGLKLGTLHRFLTLKCDEEIICYLNNVAILWSGMLGNANPKHVNLNTVEQLGRRIPKYCKIDEVHVRNSMKEVVDNQYAMFPGLKGSQREEILQNILQQRTLIPTLVTFFEDLKYLEPLSKAMKLLIEKESMSVHRSFEYMFTGGLATTCEIETAEGIFGHHKVENIDQKMELGYQQLWLYTMRHFPEMVDFTPRKENSQPKPPNQDPDFTIIFDFAQLAHRLGFDSQDIQDIRAKDPHISTAREFLAKVRPSDIYNHDSFEDSLHAIAKALQNIPKRGLTPNRPDEGPRASDDDLSRRCGRPFEFDHVHTKDQLFLPTLYSTKVRMGAHPLFIKKCFFFFCFNKYRKLNIVNGDIPNPVGNNDSTRVSMKTQEHRDTEMGETHTVPESRREAHESPPVVASSSRTPVPETHRNSPVSKIHGKAPIPRPSSPPIPDAADLDREMMTENGEKLARTVIFVGDTIDTGYLKIEGKSPKEILKMVVDNYTRQDLLLLTPTSGKLVTNDSDRMMHGVMASIQCNEFLFVNRALGFNQRVVDNYIQKRGVPAAPSVEEEKRKKRVRARDDKGR